MLKDVIYADSELHTQLMDAMQPYLEDKPQVGIFWLSLDPIKLFGVRTAPAEDYVPQFGVGSLPKLHKSFWLKEHARALAKGDTASVFYGESNYMNIPRGRVFVRPDVSLYVCVGSWWESLGSKEVAVCECIADTFNLADDFEVVIDHHWDLGRGWSEVRF